MTTSSLLMAAVATVDFVEVHGSGDTAVYELGGVTAEVATASDMRGVFRGIRLGRICRCGHTHAAHLHYRSGSECSLCPDCPRYRFTLGLVARAADLLTRRSGAH